MNRFVALLLFVTLIWGTTFPLLKELVATLSGAEISALRFLVAAMCMLPFAFRVPRHTWPDGTLLGVLALVAYVAQAWALEYISANRSAFLTSLNVLIVPLLGLLWGARVSMVVFGAAETRCVNAFTSAIASVLLRPSVKSAGRYRRFGPNAPSPTRIPLAFAVSTAHVPSFTA